MLDFEDVMPRKKNLEDQVMVKVTVDTFGVEYPEPTKM